MIPYGASAMGIWQKGNTETLEEAEELVAAFFASFPQVKKFLDNSVVDALTRGYTQDFYGRVRWYEIPEAGKASEKAIKSAQKAAARQAQNHPIQSLSASVTKMAIRNLYRFLRKKGWGYMTLTIHDSIFFEIKEEFVDVAIPEILRIMEESAREIMPVLKAPADVDVGEKIVKTDPITGTKFKVYSHNWDAELKKSVPNDDIYDPESTVKFAKELKVDLSDPMGAAVEMLQKIETQPVDWQQKNIKFITQLRTAMSR